MSEVPSNRAQYSFKVAGTTFQVLSFHMSDEMSQLFGMSLTLWSDDPAYDISAPIRQTGDVKIAWGDNEKHFYGLVTAFSQTDAGLPGKGGVDKPWGTYTVELAPTFWLLGRKTNCRIFQEKSVDEILKKVLDERGMAGKYELKLTQSYPKREYCVQYRESDLAFLSRLMEEEGIFYFFTHDGKEMMVVGDDASAYATCGPESKVEYKTEAGVLPSAKEYLSHLAVSEGAFSGKMKFKDFDYRSPKKPLKVEVTGSKHGDLELYDYDVERYRDDGRARALAKVVVESRSVLKQRVLRGGGTWRSAAAGAKVTVSHAYRGDLNGPWVIVSCRHDATQTGGTGVQYSVSLTAIPAATTFRAPGRTPRPRIDAQTATVVGPPGEPIYMDDLGRAKVQFRWDLEGTNDDNSSCWMRVAQPYAGIDENTQKKHGFQWHPLIGDEVVVEFLDGDPDRPIIIGSVYNLVNAAIVRPSEHVRNRILTPYQHQLLLDDKNTAITLNTGGSETVKLEDGRSSSDYGNNIKASTADGHYLHLADGASAQGITIETRKSNLIVLDDKKRNIRIRTTDGHEAILDDENRTIKITSTSGHRVEISDQGSFIELADTGGNSVRMDAAGGNITIRATNNLDVTAGANITIMAGGSMETTVGGSKKLTVGAKQEDTIGSTRSAVIGGHRVTTVGGNDTLNVGSGLLYKVSGSVKIKAGSSVGLKGSSISAVASGQIKSQAGSKNTMQGGTKAEVTGGIQALVQGALVKVEATGIATLKGALVKIN